MTNIFQMTYQDTKVLAGRIGEVRTHGHFIGGEWVEGHNGQTIELSNPSTGKVLGYIQSGDEFDVDRAVEAANAAFPKWSQSSPLQR
jgi:aldehyde dehydrogenase